ncbi:unnamed protein product [Caenorhabditis bovis]|uniref:Uncharacterized protein n=1 Tax=Caenorhabditis bovis TaxID=2654633 RepID=A0A8S1FBH9_9PELO|nr:unnamed protein product [Caenorhabditis bovis]
MGASSSVRSIPLTLFQTNDDSPKILVLGCMGCGKSTLIRRLVKRNRPIAVKNMYYVHTVQFNLLKLYRELRRVCDDLNLDILAYEEDFDSIYDFRHREEISDKIHAALKRLSKSGLFEECLKKRRVLPLPINYHYFYQHTDRILSKSYVPTETDIFMAYSETIGVNTESIKIGQSKFEITELPGHHIWRKRWPDFFSNVSVLTFIVDMSELCDQAFYTGYLKDKTVGIYKDLVQNPIFVHTGFLLLFNKHDTFNEHSAGFDFRKLASHLRTPHEALSYYRSQFSSISPKNRTFHHIVSLTKTKEFPQAVFDSLNKIFRQQKENARLT